jgi:peroxiredoxin Q/BCP
VTQRRIYLAGSAAILLGILGGTMIEERSGLLSVGQEAPAFTATLSTGETVNLGDFRGKKAVVLSFYPKDFTPGCTGQLCSYRDSYAGVEALGGIILGISTDGEARHIQFASTYQLPFPLISDPGRELARLYGVTRIGGGIFPVKRVSYVIDKDGVIRLVAHHEILIERHIADILKTLERIK